MAQGDVIKIGLISSLTGSVSTYGQSVRNAVTMAVDDINASGGILGRQISLIILDDKGDGTEAAQAARRLIDRENVALILGPVITPSVMAVAPICQAAGVPMLTPTGTGIKSQQSATSSSGERIRILSKAGSWPSLQQRT